MIQFNGTKAKKRKQAMKVIRQAAAAKNVKITPPQARKIVRWFEQQKEYTDGGANYWGESFGTVSVVKVNESACHCCNDYQWYIKAKDRQGERQMIEMFGIVWAISSQIS